MIFLGVIAIRFSNELEKKIKEMAKIENKSVSEYCKKILLDEHKKNEDNQLSKDVVLENEIKKIQQRIALINENLFILSKHILRQSKINAELMYSVLDIASEDDIAKSDAWESAEKSADEFLKKIFG